MDSIGDTQTMDMIEKLNNEFDEVVDENQTLKEEIKKLKDELIKSQSIQISIKDYYSDYNGPPSCDNCNDLIYYGQSYCEYSSERYTEKYCRHCANQQDPSVNQANGWTTTIIQEYD